MKTNDPVCGMTVDTESAIARSSYGGKEYFFCSTDCQHKFEARPEQYVPVSQSDKMSRADSKTEDDLPFTKTGGIVSPKFGSAGSGGLEYEPVFKPRDT